MPIISRNKRLTGIFDQDARARLTVTNSQKLTSFNTGSVYSSDSDGDSLSLSDLVHSFLEEHTNGNNDDSAPNELDSDRVDSFADSSDLKRLNAVFMKNADCYRNMLLEHVTEASENFSFLKEQNVSIFRQSVAAFLREKGHDAAVCVTAWDISSVGGATASNHEFIDVVKIGSATWRYFVDLEFRAQFEIARPTPQFSEVLSSVPDVFVGGEKELKRTVLIVCDAAKKCFRSRALSIPPWRKNRFMQNKWFAPCRRTVYTVQGKPVRVTAVNGVSCRLLGFDDVVKETRRGGSITVRTR
ncbi:uncharacterized protein [Cicer arietinum]|uniref:Uncharacterized protein LOC101514428 n=1 Tax=Cicer arietinum TaxID=3827 RepID=A0A1S2XR47_CICAR|nr:uncharacterized protein LOC101514428 [Cicer arietinum]